MQRPRSNERGLSALCGAVLLGFRLWLRRSQSVLIVAAWNTTTANFADDVIEVHFKRVVGLPRIKARRSTDGDGSENWPVLRVEITRILHLSVSPVNYRIPTLCASSAEHRKTRARRENFREK
jgi:hypothetical protein